MTDLPEKERKFFPERYPVVEFPEGPEIPPELLQEGYLEKVEKGIELKKPITDDQGQILVTSAAAQQPKIVLPMDRTTYLNPKNWHKPVTSALRWLLTWAQRIVKMHPGRTTFQEN